jgi:hypothetical protein
MFRAASALAPRSSDTVHTISEKRDLPDKPHYRSLASWIASFSRLFHSSSPHEALENPHFYKIHFIILQTQ